uniref:anthrax toxin lethal factor-related metalloendopeptidase n=1 Tax=Clostridioides difficile TaxID=1496 RepID=UPI0031B5F071
MLNKIKFIITVFLLFISCSSEVNAYRDKEISDLEIEHIRSEAFDYSSFIELDGVDYNTQFKVYKYLDVIPENIIEKFIENKMKIEITNKSLQERFLSNYILSGVYFDKTIHFSSNKDWAEQSLLHEFGHFVDEISYMDKNEFIKIYEREKDNLILNKDKDKSYYLRNVSEYFAQSFEEYLINPERLLLNNPKTYEYIKLCIDQI